MHFPTSLQLLSHCIVFSAGEADEEAATKNILQDGKWQKPKLPKSLIGSFLAKIEPIRGFKDLSKSQICL